MKEMATHSNDINIISASTFYFCLYKIAELKCNGLPLTKTLYLFDDKGMLDKLDMIKTEPNEFFANKKNAVISSASIKID